MRSPVASCTRCTSAQLERCAPDHEIKDISRSSRAMAESKPLVASSANSTEGSVNSSVAKARRRRSPPCKKGQFSNSHPLVGLRFSGISVQRGGQQAIYYSSSPEIPAPMLPMSVFLHFASPSSVISASTRCWLSAFENTPMRNCHWKSRCSRTVSPAKRGPLGGSTNLLWRTPVLQRAAHLERETRCDHALPASIPHR